MVYVMSDIHGNTPRFESVMQQIDLKPEDTLYILGDVVDRYPDGIRILRRLMKMPNVKMLIGNHEYMMLNSLNEPHVRIKSDSPWERARLPKNTRLWYRNGGEVTHNYIKHIRKDIRDEVTEYLNSLPCNMEVEVNGIKYKLVHASPEENYQGLAMFDYETKKEFAVWERWTPSDMVPEGYVLIFGHTPTTHFQNVRPWSIWKSDEAIGIDCGCGYHEGRLACLRLDDMMEFYSK